MTEGIDEVWYACYGSNIREERFLCYISGGTPPGALKHFTGCEDTTKPKDRASISIPHEMYFAKESPTWNGGGICFLDPERNKKINTLGRRYLISSGQFIDLVRQELKFEGRLHIDFQELIEHGSYDCMNQGRYGMLLYLGEIEGRPVITFTSETYLEDEINKPDKAYLNTIIKGLQETYDITDGELKEYLGNKTGVSDKIPENELLELIRAAS
ncbi:hypothetical protein GCM10023115_33290 [Pontixanthobacter gangjinensis]|uniref:Histone deacetylase n=1 Tax=Christiangramia aestuarii TaxID=1028746 RepID=A0A7K1LSF5_9FLAO|nr:hypothetical protein [Christiangramia aestuarii]MUP43745.1 hypothetical protein [Christiangramia aestuarii]